MSSPIFNEKFRRPSIGLAELLKKGAGGLYREREEYAPFMFRALVIASDNQGGRLETPDGIAEGPDNAPGAAAGKNNIHQEVITPDGISRGSYEVFPTRGPRNPKGSIRARILSANLDQFVDDDSLRTYWPLFPGLANPSAGELAYVVFEDEEMAHGLWLAKVPTSDPNATANQVLMGQILQEIAGGNAALFGATVQATTSISTSASPVRDPHRLSNLFIGTKPGG